MFFPLMFMFSPLFEFFLNDDSDYFRICLTEHSFTHCSALYRIPLELLKNKEQHNETLFFRACF